jgi:hypothetical protein
MKPDNVSGFVRFGDAGDRTSLTLARTSTNPDMSAGHPDRLSGFYTGPFFLTARRNRTDKCSLRGVRVVRVRDDG